MIHGLYSINQDIGRHLKMGEIIWQTKSVPDTNLFSYTEPDHEFINHHWLGEVLFYGLNNLVGLKGLIVFKVLINLLSFFVIFWTVRKKSKTWAILFSFFLAVLVFIERTDVRPEIFSYFFLAIFLLAIYKSKYEFNYHWLYLLPIIQLIWVNTHIYFALGPGLLLIYLIDRLVHDRQNRAIFKRLGAIFGLVLLVNLFNPNTLAGALEPLTILANYGYTIAENQGIFFLHNYGLSGFEISVFSISAIILFLGFIHPIKQGYRKFTFEFLISLAFTIMAMKMIRNFGPYALVFAFVNSLNYSLWISNLNFKIKKYLYFLVSVFLIILTWGIIEGSFYDFIDSSRKVFNLDIPTGAEGAVQFIKNAGIKGPVFNNFDVGSYIIWKMWPEEKVFVDGRPEAYSVDFFEKIYKPMQQDPKVWNELSEKYKINYIFFAHTDITPWAETFLNRITSNPKWSLIYLDDNSVIFIKNAPANKMVIDKYKIGK
jgi:hypothetical protein